MSIRLSRSTTPTSFPALHAIGAEWGALIRKADAMDRAAEPCAGVITPCRCPNSLVDRYRGPADSQAYARRSTWLAGAWLESAGWTWPHHAKPFTAAISHFHATLST